MRHIKELIRNHKAISIGLALVLVLVVVDGGIFFRNIMNRPAEIQQEIQEEQKFEEEKQQEQQQQQQQQQEQQQPGNNTTPRPTPTCNQAAANNFINQYNASVNAENARHNARLAEIANGPEQYPGDKQIATARENALHQQNLTNLQNQLNANLRSVNC